MDGNSYIQFEVPEYSSTVLSQLNELRMQGKLCDIIVHIQGQPFRAHKAVLAASSPYFRDHSALSTMSGLSISVIKNPDVFEQLLSFCYTGRMSVQVKDVVSFLTAASFLQMQCVIDKCTQILETIHSKISVVGAGGEDNLSNHNGVKDDRYFANPVEISPPYSGQVRPLIVSNGLRLEAIANKSLRHRSQEEGQSDRGSSGSASEHEIQIDGDPDHIEVVQESPVAEAEVKVKPEKSDRPSCSDSSSLGDDGYHTELVDGEQVTMLNVGSYGSVLQHAFPYSQNTSQATNLSEPYGTISSASPSRSMLSCYRGGRMGRKRPLSLNASDGHNVIQSSESETLVSPQSYETSPRERAPRGYWNPYSERLVCIYCGKTFNQKGSLDRHMRLHMGITPFVCRFCGKKYTRKDQLEYHIRGHTDDKPFRCEVCGKCFPFQGTLNQHLRKNHPGVAEVRSRMESPERTEVYAEQNDTSASEVTLDSDIHTVSTTPD
ncbi:zinc finger and BTB domain-containing protein 34 [Gastrophryne carolinensis]